MIQGIQQSLLFKKMQKDCKAEGIELPKNIMAKDPRTHVLMPQEYLRNVEARTMPPMNNHNVLKEMAEKAAEQSDKVFDDGVLGFQVPEPAQNTRTTKMQVTNVALQTDSCDTLYVTKNTLVAYTIAVVQNSQMLQYNQMHVALQTAQNQASLETLLQAEQLITAHFNLAVLANETKTNETIDAQKPETTTVDAEPSTSTADEETYVKIPSWHNAANHDSNKAHPTGAVIPTCRRDYGLVNRIPVGYETDDSWDHNSLTHEPEHTHTHTHNIVPLLALRTWTNCPNRGWEQPHRQNNNINVRSGNATYPRPWEGQPYRRRTRSQQAFCARAYRKWQRRYPVP